VPHPDEDTVLCWLADKKMHELTFGVEIKALERNFPYR